MAKSSETYRKVAATAKKKADRFWAQAKSGEGGHYYDMARTGYETVKRAEEKAKSLEK
jgi:hypothetical protein